MAAAAAVFPAYPIAFIALVTRHGPQSVIFSSFGIFAIVVAQETTASDHPDSQLIRPPTTRKQPAHRDKSKVWLQPRSMPRIFFVQRNTRQNE
jgi:hypothetical protein